MTCYRTQSHDVMSMTCYRTQSHDVMSMTSCYSTESHDVKHHCEKSLQRILVSDIINEHTHVKDRCLHISIVESCFTQNGGEASTPCMPCFDSDRFSYHRQRIVFTCSVGFHQVCVQQCVHRCPWWVKGSCHRFLHPLIHPWSGQTGIFLFFVLCSRLTALQWKENSDLNAG